MTTPRTLAVAALLLASCGTTGDEPNDAPMTHSIRTQEISYDAGGTPLRGYFAMPDDVEGDVPGVLVIHEWWGHNDYVRGRAEQLAELGFAAFALDMYGDGKTADHPDSAGAFMNEVMGTAGVMQARFTAALGVLHAQDGVDAGRTAAMAIASRGT